LQIARHEVTNPLRLARRALWEVMQERRAQAAISLGDGVQCNGTPTFQVYGKLTARPLLFFDTRTRGETAANGEQLRQRFRERSAGGKLRLGFSGRLVAIKGVDHLMRVARSLRQRRVPFELSICGSGHLEPAMRRYVAQEGLSDFVHFHGNLEFERELVPFLRDNIDIFLSCHRQGDPSCTYLETMACGVPIVGYNNEAFAGLVEHSGCGWLTPMNRPGAMAGLLASLTSEQIEAESFKSLAFAIEHTFEKEFERRILHLRGLRTVLDV
jgi:glycosyltransferase involved in cell wall biosynthesis